MFMKKVLIIFCILISIVLCSCNIKEHSNVDNSTYNFETDMQYYYRYQSYVNPITASSNGYYIVGEHNIVLYVDKKTMDVAPLCNKANCKHDDPDTCNAYIINELMSYSPETSSTKNLIQYYKGNIYVVDFQYNSSTDNYEAFLCKYDLDGTNYQIVSSTLTNFNLLSDWFIHRGYLYYTSENEIYRLLLDNSNNKVEKILKIENHIKGARCIMNLLAYGNYMYFLTLEETNEETQMKYHSLDLQNLKQKEMIYEGKEIVYCCGFVKNKVIFMLQGNNSNNSEISYNNYYIADLDLKNGKKLTTQKWGYNLSTDGKYYYTDNAAKLDDNKKSDENIGQIITIYNLDMEIVDSFIFPYNKIYTFLGAQDRDNFFVFLLDKNKNYNLYFIDKSNIGTFKGREAKISKLCKLKWTDKTSENIIAMN